jgi:formate hydrogenlyase subunit 6/NADH:ubiquinone oxidoreductase subunit I
MSTTTEGAGGKSVRARWLRAFAVGVAILALSGVLAGISSYAIQALYPEVFRCVACNTCTKACPQDLEVMDYIQAAKRGDIAAVMDLSFDCVMCGLCAIRCPSEIVQFNVGLLAKRLYGRYLAPKSPELEKRLREVKRRKFDKEYDELMSAKKAELKKKYYDRDSE